MSRRLTSASARSTFSISFLRSIAVLSVAWIVGARIRGGLMGVDYFCS